MIRCALRRPARSSRKILSLRHSLVTKLLVVSAVVSVCSVTATTWLVVHSTAVAIHQEEGQDLADEAQILDTLRGYAATHNTWNGAAGVLRRLSAASGLAITLTDVDRRPLTAGPTAAKASPNGKTPHDPTATIDALHVGPLPAGVQRHAGSGFTAACVSRTSCTLGRESNDGIDPRAVGPFLLPTRERTQLRNQGLKAARCLRETWGITAGLQQTLSGSTKLAVPYPTLSLSCGLASLSRPTTTESRALARLDDLVTSCLVGTGAPHVSVNLDMTWTQTTKAAGAIDYQRISTCVTAARRVQLLPYVAPPALLFVSAPHRTASTFLDLSPANRTRISLTAAAALLVTLAVTIAAALRIIRPLRTLAHATNSVAHGDLSTRVTIAAQDEIGHLAGAFNAMSGRLEASERARKDMVNDIAHELRNPLSNIRAWVEAAQDGLAADDELLSTLLSESMTLQYIVDDLRDLAALDAGELGLGPEDIDVAKLLAWITEAHQTRATEARVALTIHVDRPLYLSGDPLRLRQMVGNLVSNAVRHTPPGGQIRLSAATEGDQILIQVADNGNGIAAAELPHIFERFWRGEKSRDRRHGGSGLGLSIVRKLTELHGGHVTVTSATGRGTTFTLHLPTASPPTPGTPPS